MIKSRRKFELALKDIHRLIDNPSAPDRYSELHSAAWNFRPFIEAASGDVAKAVRLIHVTRLLRHGTGPGRQKAEEKLMGLLDWMAHVCVLHLEEAGFPSSGNPPTAPPAEKFKAQWTVLRLVCDYAISCFEFKRARDSFGGRRRAAAFEILQEGLGIVNLSEVIPIAERIFDEGRVDGWAAREFLETHERLFEDEE